MSEDTKYKPCPFCGCDGEPDVDVGVKVNTLTVQAVCSKCGAGGRVDYLSESRALLKNIKRWALKGWDRRD